MCLKSKILLLVFRGKKIEDTKAEALYLQTNDYKFSTQRDNELGVSFVNFQHKYWFYKAISIRYLNALVNKIHIGLKIELI